MVLTIFNFKKVKVGALELTFTLEKLKLAIPKMEKVRKVKVRNSKFAKKLEKLKLEISILAIR